MSDMQVLKEESVDDTFGEDESDKKDSTPDDDDNKSKKNKKSEKSPKKAKEKDKKSDNDMSRFHGEGISFAAKIIGDCPVTAHRGEGVCKEAIESLYTELVGSKEHKQKVILRMNLEGIRVSDAATSEGLYSFSIARISYVWKDLSNPRTFGMIAKHTDPEHFQFYALRTEKPSNMVLLEMKRLFNLKLDQTKNATAALSPDTAPPTSPPQPSTVDNGKPVTGLPPLTHDQIPQQPTESVDAAGTEAALKELHVNTDSNAANPEAITPPSAPSRSAPAPPPPAAEAATLAAPSAAQPGGTDNFHLLEDVFNPTPTPPPPPTTAPVGATTPAATDDVWGEGGGTPAPVASAPSTDPWQPQPPAKIDRASTNPFDTLMDGPPTSSTADDLFDIRGGGDGASGAEGRPATVSFPILSPTVVGQPAKPTSEAAAVTANADPFSDILGPLNEELPRDKHHVPPKEMFDEFSKHSNKQPTLDELKQRSA